MRGGPIAPYGGKMKDVLGKGVSWLVVLEEKAINMQKTYLSLLKKPYYTYNKHYSK